MDKLGPEPLRFADLETTFTNVVSVVLTIGGIALFVMLIRGGFTYLTSGGDPKAIEGAKKTLSYAILGIVLLAMSYLFLAFIEKFTGARVGIFKLFLDY